MKENGFYSLDLTTKNNLASGFKKRHEDVTKEDIQKAIKNALESLRRKAMTRGWSYIIYVAISNIHQSQGGRIGNWHAHILIYGNPCWTIIKELKSYWTRHHYANAKQCKLQKCWDGGKVGYVRVQEKAHLFQKVNATNLLDSLDLPKTASKTQVLDAWSTHIDTTTKSRDTEDYECPSYIPALLSIIHETDNVHDVDNNEDF